MDIPPDKGVPTVAEGGTSARTVEEAQQVFGYALLDGGNDFTGDQRITGAVNVNGPVTVADENLEVTGNGYVKLGLGLAASISGFDVVALRNDRSTITAARYLDAPDETGYLAVFPRASLAAGDMIYWDGTRPVRVPKGNDGDVLKLVTGVPTWVAP